MSKWTFEAMFGLLWKDGGGRGCYRALRPEQQRFSSDPSSWDSLTAPKAPARRTPRTGILPSKSLWGGGGRGQESTTCCPRNPILEAVPGDCPDGPWEQVGDLWGRGSWRLGFQPPDRTLSICSSDLGSGKFPSSRRLSKSRVHSTSPPSSKSCTDQSSSVYFWTPGHTPHLYKCGKSQENC